MSVATLILGNSGTGKTTSLRNFDPSKCTLIQCISKPLPFRSNDWIIRDDENTKGNVIQTSESHKIIKILSQSPKEVIIIDDFQNSMVDELMGRKTEKNYEKFTDIADNARLIFKKSGSLKKHQRVYILAHTNTNDFGEIKMKTIGKMIDQSIIPESYFTIVLRTEVSNGKYLFRTQCNGNDCCKSPMNLFDDLTIENDLDSVDNTICSFYGLNKDFEAPKEG